MTKIEIMLKELSDLYRFYSKIPKIKKQSESGNKREALRKSRVTQK